MCDTVTAEVSPHFRPESWTPTILNQVNERPVRITGQLFFDGNHKPCVENKVASPARSSVWEIHPIYGIDVCVNSSLRSCKAGKESVWIPLYPWAELDEDHGDND